MCVCIFITIRMYMHIRIHMCVDACTCIYIYICIYVSAGPSGPPGCGGQLRISVQEELQSESREVKSLMELRGLKVRRERQTVTL